MFQDDKIMFAIHSNALKKSFEAINQLSERFAYLFENN